MFLSCHLSNNLPHNIISSYNTIFARRQQVSSVQDKLFHDRGTLAPLAFKSRPLGFYAPLRMPS